MWNLVYLLQKEENGFSIDNAIVSELLNNIRFSLHKINSSIDDLDSLFIAKSKMELSKYIPIGSLQFVRKFLSYIYDISDINPIEIPEPLRNKLFVKRKYSIVGVDDIPKSGMYFVKDASFLKGFSFCGDLRDLNREMFDKNHLYVLSEMVNIKSEYRIYVFGDEIETICQYNGHNLSIFEDCFDIDLIKKAVLLLSYKKDFPRSYTIDVMVSQYGTEIIEVHPFISIGLYTTLWGYNLLQAYKDGIDYVVNYNAKLKPFEV